VQAVAPRALAPFEAPGAEARLDDVTAAVQRLTRSLYLNADQLACLRGF